MTQKRYTAAVACVVQGVRYAAGETINPAKHNLDSIAANNVRCGLFMEAKIQKSQTVKADKKKSEGNQDAKLST